MADGSGTASVTVPEGGNDQAAPFALDTRLGRYDLIGVLGQGGMGVVFEAFDPALDRAVAVKVLSACPPGSPAGHAGAAGRLAHEGVIMARLAHPNVIRVYDVGIEDGHTFVAMELVRGTTLGGWVGRAPRSAAEVLVRCVQAGRGLAAVHDAGLIHRDFKPQNVLVGDDGRVLVTDFGIARMTGDSGSAHASGSSQATDRTATEPGRVLGTPAYMAPEQLAGAEVDARADQYSFCLTAVRLLTASWPDAAALDPAVAVRRVRGLSRRAREALARGLARDPAARFPSMYALLHRLDPRSRQAYAWAAVGGAGALAAVVLAVSGGHAADPCPAPAAQVAAVWSAPRASALRTHLASVDPQQGAARFAAAERKIEGYARAWSAQHVEGCRDTRVRGVSSDTMLDRRRVCLDRALTELDDSVAALQRTADRYGVDDAMSRIAGLNTLASCTDVAALAEQVPPPTDLRARAEFDALSREITAIATAGTSAGQRDDVMARATAAVQRARRFGHPALIAEALWTQASLELELESDAGLATLREHVAAASAAHDDRMVVTSWTRQIAALCDRRRAAEAESLLPAVAAAAARGGDPVMSRFRLQVATGHVAVLRGDVARADRALAAADRALDEAAAAGADVSLERVSAGLLRGNALGRPDHWREAAAAFHRVITLIEARLGPDHPEAVVAHFNEGVALWHAGAAVDALAALREAARIGETRLPPSPRLSTLLGAIGSLLLDGADADGAASKDALPFLERATAMARDTLPPDDVRLARPTASLAAALANLHQLPAARAQNERAIALLDKAGDTSVVLANSLFNLGQVEQLANNCRAAFAPLERARGLYARLGGEDSDDVRGTINLVAACNAQLGRWAEAIAAATHVLSSPGVTPGERAAALVVHGKALAATGRVAAGVREVREARAAMVEQNLGRDELAQVDAWLATHR